MSCIMKHLITPFTICGDFSAHDIIWGSDHSDAGEHLNEDAINKYGIALLNEGSITFMSGHSYARCQDLPMCSSNFASCVMWRTNFETRDSDHIPILIHHPKLLYRRDRPRVSFKNWKAFSCFNTTSLNQIKTIEDFTRCVRKNHKQATRNLPVSQGNVGNMREYERLRAIRRQAERRCRRTRCFEAYKRAQEIHGQMLRQLQRFCRKIESALRNLHNFYPSIQGIWYLKKFKFCSDLIATIPCFGCSSWCVWDDYGRRALCFVRKTLGSSEYCRVTGMNCECDNENLYAYFWCRYTIVPPTSHRGIAHCATDDAPKQRPGAGSCHLQSSS